LKVVDQDKAKVKNLGSAVFDLTVIDHAVKFVLRQLANSTRRPRKWPEGQTAHIDLFGNITLRESFYDSACIHSNLLFFFIIHALQLHNNTLTRRQQFHSWVSVASPRTCFPFVVFGIA
jgi:hypothetical protein